MSLPKESNGSAIDKQEQEKKEETKNKILELLEKHELDIESLGQNVNQIKLQLDQLPQVVQNSVLNVIQGIQANSQPQEQVRQVEMIQTQGKTNYAQILQDPAILQSVVEKLLNKIFHTEQPATDFLGLGEDFFKERLKNKIIADMDLEDTIVENVKATLKSKAVKQISTNVIKHAIE